MNANTIDVYCDGSKMDYIVPDSWPICSDLAVCKAPNIIAGLMESDEIDTSRQSYIMEGDHIK